MLWVRSSPRIDDRHLTPLLREVDRGLAGGVAATDHDHGLPGADPRFQVGGRVVDARAFEPLEIVDGEPLVARAGSDDDRAGRDLAAVGEHDDLEAVLDSQAGNLARSVQPRAEPLRLDGRSRRELFAGDAVREPDVVLDARAGTRLAAGRDRVERDGVEPLGGPVHRGGQAGGTAAHHDEVEHVPRRLAEREPEVFGELARATDGAGRRWS